MKTTIQIKSVFGKLLFKFKKEDNSIKQTLIKAVKSGAYLSRVNLSGANLYESNLSRANLSGANLFGANLFGADLSGANLSGADLSGADLSGADLSRADLSRANLSRAKVELSQIKVNYWLLPEEGEFIGWKCCKDNKIVKLLIPSNAQRSCTTISRKCRAEFVKVLEIRDLKGNIFDEAYSEKNNLCYKTGEIVRPDSYDNDFRVDCSNGIHFFITCKEAINYI